MNLKDSQDLQHLQDSQKIFNLGLSWVEFSQLKDLMEHTKHSELEADHYEKLKFISSRTINSILNKLKKLGFQEGAKSDDFFFNDNNPY